MRLRIAMLAPALVAVGGAAVPTVAAAAPHSNQALTIHNTPSNVFAGERVLIFGHLKGRHVANQPIVLWHRIHPNTGFTIVSRTTTDAQGRYEFIRASGVVNTNRDWFVRGPIHSHSMTVHEKVSAELSIAPSAASAATRQSLTFSGKVIPAHKGSPVDLQVQRGVDNKWTTVERGQVGSGSQYSIAYRWRRPGTKTVRAYFPGDSRNVASSSDPTTVVVNQRQVPTFTINTSAPITTTGAPVTISGNLYQPHTTTGQANTAIGLYASSPGAANTLVQPGTTAADGSYSFTVQPTVNTVYTVHATADPARRTAKLFQGVADTVSLTPSATTATTTAPVTFTGTVAPGKSGHYVDLEKLGPDGNWHVISTAQVSSASTYTFSYAFGYPGTKQLRVRVLGGPVNVGGVSTPVSVTITLAPLSTLPVG